MKLPPTEEDGNNGATTTIPDRIKAEQTSKQISTAYADFVAQLSSSGTPLVRVTELFL